MPPAPPRFSTTNCWPTFSWSLTATMRVKKSRPPPGGNVTMMRTGFAGQACAPANCGASAKAATTAHATSASMRLRVIFSLLLVADPHARLLDHRAPAIELRPDEAPEFVGRSVAHLSAERLYALAHIGKRGDALHFDGEPLDDTRRHTAR